MNQVQQPLVSIITVVYNAVRTLEQTILSVLNQDYSSIEYIIIDGGSTDGSLAIVEKYRSRIAYYCSEPDQGIYDAMNKGLQQATGAFVGILNADDFYELSAVRTVVQAFQANSQIHVVHGLLRILDAQDEPDTIVGHAANFLNFGMIEHPTCFVKKSIYEQMGGFDLAYSRAGDYELMLRIRKAGATFWFLPVILANFRKGGLSVSWQSSLETINLRYRYGYISKLRRMFLLAYWYLNYTLFTKKIK
ncbi:glycosyltransferase family 2 protein [Olivibacter ginsenosidimutans]|uniref:Glycosyltransferase family 2 protein n=1 Tax=Olivibacter ginsenosidimutans TaxID=1176537 RepID=A0ABP9ATC8_9SPHI